MPKKQTQSIEQTDPIVFETGALAFADTTIDFSDAPATFDDETPDPFANIPYSGDIENDSLAEMTALQSAFAAKNTELRARDVAIEKKLRDQNDSEFWIAIAFQTRAQKEQFLRALDLIKFGDKYLSGYQVAKKLGVTLDDPNISYKPMSKSKRLSKLT